MTTSPRTGAAALRILIAGAGFSGAVLGRRLAEAGHLVQIHEARDHIAGNCHTVRCPQTGVMEHLYGPHIFHTDSPRVQEYITGFGSFRPYVNRVKTTSEGRVFGLPVNLHTINQYFGTTLRPEEARAFIASRATPPAHGGEPQNFEEQALAMIGPELYNAFFRGYTIKQWGCDPRSLPAAILKRLPLRFNYDDNYFAHPFQAMPEQGYTALVAAILDHPGISVTLKSPVVPGSDFAAGFDHIIWTGPLDGWFHHDEGRLGYRTLDFRREALPDCRDWQGCAVMNYGDVDVPFTRISEHRHFAPWEDPQGTLIVREYSRSCEPGDIPYYPIRQTGEMELLSRYTTRARALQGVTFLGRLGTYRYLDMDVTIREALEAADILLEAIDQGRPLPVFPVGDL